LVVSVKGSSRASRAAIVGWSNKQRRSCGSRGGSCPVARPKALLLGEDCTRRLHVAGNGWRHFEPYRIEGMSALDSLASKAIWDLQEGGTAACCSWRGSLPEDVLRNRNKANYLRSTGIVLPYYPPSLHNSRDACTARHGRLSNLSPKHIQAAPKEAWLGAGTETADRGVGKVTPPFRPSKRGAGAYFVQ
jgi:hypothetical protein